MREDDIDIDCFFDVLTRKSLFDIKNVKKEVYFN